ncbi:MAG: hypothetical protein RL033_2951 [Pseudomonadota bacterium]|jgi:hypothetical protein
MWDDARIAVIAPALQVERITDRLLRKIAALHADAQATALDVLTGAAELEPAAGSS